MAQITRNNCNISNLRPLEVTCVPTNASAPGVSDGSISLYINGGTSPYTVSWSTGAQGYPINGLVAGCYTATITDYYEDYTETITCCIENDTFYIDEFLKCADNFDGDIFVFYDGTSLNYEDAVSGSESVRNWFGGKKAQGYGGNLYEGVIGKVSNNGENWLWWATYPYLGSLTGGTLTGGTPIEYFGASGESVSNSVFNNNWCQNSSGECVPNPASFNFGDEVISANGSTITSDVYKRINNGFKLTGQYGVPDENSMGVPFTVTPSMDGNYTTVFGDFIGGVKNYICIIVADESDDQVGLYHGRVDGTNNNPNKDFLFTNPFEQEGSYWDDNTLTGPSDRYSHDYESFIKVWEEIKDSGGSFNGYIYPVVTNTRPAIPFIQHAVATIEGETITDTEFSGTYGTEIYDVGPENLNLSALTRTNVYTGMTGTTAYQNLDPSYKNGPGLKNFNWVVDPTVESFNGGVIGNKLDEYFDSIQYSSEYIYTTPFSPPLIEDSVYKLSAVDGCYSYQQRLLRSSEEYYSGASITGSFGENNCLECQPSTSNAPFQPTLCLSDGTNQYQFNPSGSTNGYFVWYNSDNSLTLNYSQHNNRWEITPWTNVGLGAMVREVNESIPSGTFVNLGVTNTVTWTMTEGMCTGIPLTVTSQVSNETCRGTGNGSVILLGSGGYEPYEYRVQNVSPYPNYSITGIFNDLTPGNYLGEISDNSGNTSTTIFTIQQGEIGVNYTVSLTSTVTNNGTGTRSWTYGVQVNPTLASGVELTFDIVLNHQRVHRDTGVHTFSYTHTITKNGSLNIPYTTSSENTNTIDTSCTAKPTQEITTTFSDTASSVTFSSTDTSINGNVTQTVTIDGTGLNCSPECRMIGTYNTSLQITNLSISGSECSQAVNAFTPINENITISDCDAQP